MNVLERLSKVIILQAQTIGKAARFVVGEEEETMECLARGVAQVMNVLGEFARHCCCYSAR